MKMRVEICCGSYDDCIQSEKGGADRVELNSALFLGGLTPSDATVRKTIENCHLPIICMVRPRGAGFCYQPWEAEIMFSDAERMLNLGCAGIAFGFLNEDRTINNAWTKRMIELIHSYPGKREAVFHRAFDCVQDMDASIQLLISLGCDRVLTSGGKGKAFDGAERIRDLQKNYGNKIEILAGSGINAGNAADLILQTGIAQVHSSAKTWEIDSTTTAQDVSYAYHGKFDYDAVSLSKVRELADAVRNMQHSGR
ncbi:MAG: copper homeostasis protein CutC [Solobacterium sp.]|jgi:copper homeostasis protein|nr:copper homeostasis protein CutC [Solobacterium sp.]MCH4205982.1 copper homeostasis protein CutC [Solobacterium sp.]MCH4227410.1 copper homeostasis protein CutC [Solobacterium sp.]MCH4282779.1 copper homeostasis protein CutC [Solobacterium sp.]